MAIKRSSSNNKAEPKSNREEKKPKKSLNRDATGDSRLVSAKNHQEETENQESRIRPRTLNDYIGQKELKKILNIAIAAAKARQESLDHLLLYDYGFVNWFKTRGYSFYR